MRRQPMTLQRAEEIAATALMFLVDDIGRLTQFLSATGLTPQLLRSDASSHRVLAAVLDYLAQDESLLLVFASGAGVAPTDIAPARDTLQDATRGGIR